MRTVQHGIWLTISIFCETKETHGNVDRIGRSQDPPDAN
jgi:hypothetical protein